jgi:hypothetical protein
VKLAITFFLAAAAALPQSLSFGVKAGVPATDLVKSETWQFGRYSPESGRYIIGPVIELRLPFGFGVEFNALYRPVKYRVHYNPFAEPGEASGGAWQFPLLAKYRFGGPFVSPYLSGGFAFNRLSGLKELGDLREATVPGFVVAAGLEGRLPFIRLAPELRYTRWTADNLENRGGGFGVSNRNQLEALIGITF